MCEWGLFQVNGIALQPVGHRTVIEYTGSPESKPLKKGIGNLVRMLRRSRYICQILFGPDLL